MNTEQLKAAIAGEFRASRHNITTLHLRDVDACPCGRDNSCPHWPDFLRGALESGIAELERMCKRKHGVNVNFYTYGRGDATLLPGTWIDEEDGFSPALNLDLRWVDDGAAGDKQLKQVLAVLRTLNSYCRDEVRKLPARWREYVAEVVRPELAEIG